MNDRRKEDELKCAHNKALEVLRYILASAMCVVFVLLVASI